MGGVLACPAGALAQTGRPYRICSLFTAPSATTSPYEEEFLSSLSENGFERNRNLAYVVRNHTGEPSSLPAVVEELISLKPSLLVALEQVAVVMRSKTRTIPIVMPASTDPIGAGLVENFARPGGNVTGIAALIDVVAAKNFEIFRELLPRLKTVAILLDPGVPGAANASIERHVQIAAKAANANAITYWAKDLVSLEKLFAEMGQNRPDAIIASSSSGLHMGNRQLIVDSALRMRIPLSSVFSAYADANALFTYGASLHGMFRQAASHAVRILKGGDPASIPVEQPTRFELVVNLRTAKALGISVPQAVVLRADRVIE